MKKHATLLIQHLEAIYTMVEHEPIIHHGFLAMVHDEVLALGEGDGKIYIDKDTRILEGRGHFAVPAFCDVSLCLPYQSFHSDPMVLDDATSIRNLMANTTVLMKHGTLVGNSLIPYTTQELQWLEVLKGSQYFDFFQRTPTYPIVDACTSNFNAQKPFCISCGYDQMQCLDQLLCAKYIYHRFSIPAMTVLKACTYHPAKALGLPRIGSLFKGQIANVLLLEGNAIEDVLQRFYGDEHLQVIKEGTRIYPTVLI